MNKYREYLIDEMSTVLCDNPEALAVYTAYHRLSDDTALWRKITEAERFLSRQWLMYAHARSDEQEGSLTEE